MDIIVGEARRRRSDEEKRSIVAETFIDGQTVARVARRHKLNPSMVFAWRRQYPEGLNFVACPEPISLTPAVITPAEDNGPTTVNEALTKHAPVVELDFESGARLRIFGAAAPDLVKAVIEAMTER